MPDAAQEVLSRWNHKAVHYEALAAMGDSEV